MEVRTEAADDGRTVVFASGEVDLATAETLGDALRAAVTAERATAVVVDLAAVSFLDSTGIRVLIEGHRDATDAGVTLTVRHAHDMVERVLQVTGVASLLGLKPS